MSDIAKSKMTAYHRVALVLGSLIFGSWVLLLVLAPALAPFAPNATIRPLASPGMSLQDGSVFWFGTDHIGRDILSRCLIAARNNLALVGASLVLAYLVGLPVAVAATAGLWPLSASAKAVLGISRAVPFFIAYFVLIHSTLPVVGTLTAAFVVALVVASLPSIAESHRTWREAIQNLEKTQPVRYQGAVFLLVDVLKRLVFYTAILEGISAIGFAPLPLHQPMFGGMVFETRQMGMSFPHMAFLPIATLFVLLAGTGLLANGVEGLLPPALRKADPARPVFRPGKPIDKR